MAFVYGTNGAQFNGTSQYFTRAVVSTVVDNFSLCAWVKFGSIASQRYVHNGDDSANGYALQMSSAGVIRGEYHFVAFITSAVTAGINIWYHVALIRSGGSGQMYVNGALSGGTSASVPNAPASWTAIGASQNTAGTPSYFNGTVDDVRMYERAITAGEVKQLYDRRNDLGVADISSTNLKFHYKLDESSGNAADSSGGGFTITNTGTVPYVEGALPSEWLTPSSIVRNKLRPAIFTPGFGR